MLARFFAFLRSLFAGPAPYIVPMPMVIGPETVVVSQPASVPAFSNANPPKGTVGVTLWGPVEKLPAPPTNAASGGGVLDITIDSASIPGNVAARSGLGTIVLGYTFATSIAAKQYRYSYDIRVPRADHDQNCVAQAVAYLNLHDRTSRTNLWLGQIAYDSRFGKGGDVMWDQGTNTPIYNVVAPQAASAPFGDWRSLSFVVGPADIVAAAAALRAKYPTLTLSENPADYVLTHLNLNPEVRVVQGQRARIDIGVRNWRLATAGSV